MASKKDSRLRRAKKTRAKIQLQGKTRLCMFRSPKHIYAQVISADSDQVLASASSIEADVRQNLKNGGNVDAAKAVGARIAEKAKQAGVTQVAFDRSGFKYHGRTKAFADAAREGGLEF